MLNFRNPHRLKIAVKSMLSVVAVTAIAVSLLLITPTPVKALDINLNPVSGSNILVMRAKATFKADILVQQSVDIVPVQRVNVEFAGDQNGTYYCDSFSDLPLETTTTPVTITSDSAPTNTITVSATASDSWGGVTPGVLRQGFGYVETTSATTLGTGTHTLGGDYGYGYKYSPYNGDASISYTISWTPPSTWPAGTYQMKAWVKGDSQQYFTEKKTFNLTDSAGGTVTTPFSELTPEKTAENTWNLENVVDWAGRFQNNVIVSSDDGNVSLAINQGTLGMTRGGGPIEGIKFNLLDPSIVPEPPATINNKPTIFLAFDIEAGDVTFDEPIDLTIDYDLDNLPPDVDESQLVIVWYDDFSGEWVELPTTVNDVAHRVTAKLTHLSIYGVMAKITAEEIPETSEPVIETIETEQPVEEPVDEPIDEVVQDDVEVPVETDVVSSPEKDEEPSSDSTGIATWVWIVIGVGVVAMITAGYVIRRKRLT